MSNSFSELLARQKNFNLKPSRPIKNVSNIVTPLSSLVGNSTRIWLMQANSVAACMFLSMVVMQAIVFLFYYQHRTYAEVTRLQYGEIKLSVYYPVWPLVLLMSLVPGALHLALSRRRAMFEVYVIDVFVFGYNSLRWIQYCFTESIVLLLTAHVAGVAELWTLMAILMGIAIAMGMLCFSEEENQPSASRKRKGAISWQMFTFSCLSQGWIWLMLIQSALTTAAIGRRLLVLSVVALNMCIQLIMAARYLAYPSFMRRHFPYETGYIARDLVTKGLLGWGLILQMVLAIRQDTP